MALVARKLVTASAVEADERVLLGARCAQHAPGSARERGVDVVIGFTLVAAEIEHVDAVLADVRDRRTVGLELVSAVSAELEERLALRRLAPRPPSCGCGWHHLTPFYGVPCAPGERRAPVQVQGGKCETRQGLSFYGDTEMARCQKKFSRPLAHAREGLRAFGLLGARKG